MDKQVENTKPNTIRNRFSDILTVVLFVFSICCLIVSGILFYQKRYLTPFWVNGQSMYPTLNGELRDEGKDTPTGFEGGGTEANATYVDYGVMDTHKLALNHLKRFDIVITKYAQFDVSNKIKRVIALPGETFRFVSTGVGNENNGNLEVKVKGEYKVIDQPIDINIVRAGIYSSEEYTLGDDEYFVCGDNRYPGKSADSRSYGPIEYKWLVGKVVALTGYCETYINESGQLDVKNITHHAPRFL